MNRPLTHRFAPLLALAFIGCQASKPPSNGGSSGSGGNGSSSGGAGGGSSSATGGSSGSGTGGSSAPTGGTSGGTGGTTAGTGGSSAGTGGTGTGGTSGTVDAAPDAPSTGAPACPTTMGTNTANLTVKLANVSARRVVAGQAGMFRIDRDPVSGDIVVMTREGGTSFFKLDPAANTLTAYNTGHPAGGIRTGMAFGSDGAMYTVVVNTGGGTSATIRKGVGMGATKTWTTMANTAAYPASASNFDHYYAGVVASPDNKYIYFSSGSRTDHGEDQSGREAPLSSAVFRLPITATNLMLPNNEAMLKTGGYLFADGLRNTFDMGFNADGEMIAGDNGPDIDLPDEVNHIQEGKHYGFPWRFGGEDNPVLDPAYTKAGDMRLHGELQAVQRDTYNYDSGFAAKPAGVTFVDPIPNRGPDGDKVRMGKAGAVMDNTDRGMPLAGITAHRSPAGIAFDTKGILCGDYHKAGFLVSYGAVQDYMGDRGEDLLMLNLTKNASGQYEMKTTQIVVGIRTPIDTVLVDNKLYTISYNGAQNTIFEFTFPKTP